MRDIREEPAVSQALDTARELYERIDDIYESLQWRLSRAPEDGIELRSEGDAPIYLFITRRDVPTQPSLTVLYEYDNQCVSLLAVDVVPPSRS